MREPYTQLYVHLVWATWQRLPLITHEIKRVVYASIQSECRDLRVELVALGGMSDHVHLLARIPASLSVSNLVKQAKGSTSHLITHGIGEAQPFKWQGGYGAFSVTKRDVATIAKYIENQERHHVDGTVWPTAERTEP